MRNQAYNNRGWYRRGAPRQACDPVYKTSLDDLTITSGVRTLTKLTTVCTTRT